MVTQNEDLYIEDSKSNYRRMAGMLTVLLICYLMWRTSVERENDCSPFVCV